MPRPRLPAGQSKDVRLIARLPESLAARFVKAAKGRGLSRSAALRQAIEAWLGLPDHQEVAMANVTVPRVPTVPQAPPSNVDRVVPPDPVRAAQVPHRCRAQGDPVREWYDRGTLRKEYACDCGKVLVR